MAKTGLGETTIQRWVQELKLRGWIVVLETGSTPLTTPMALTVADSTPSSSRRSATSGPAPWSPATAVTVNEGISKGAVERGDIDCGWRS